MMRGTQSGDCMYTDGAGMPESDGVTDRELPQHLVPYADQHSNPDLMLVRAQRDNCTLGKFRSMSMARKRGCKIYLVEVKCAVDLEVHGPTPTAAAQQHAALCTRLRLDGWDAEVLPFVVGNYGLMRSDSMEVLNKLGIGSALLAPLPRQSAKSAVKGPAEPTP